MSRCLLHINKLDAFKTWLDTQGMAYRPGKGDYQVLQVLTAKSGWQVVFRRADMPEHYSTNIALDPVIRQFIKESK